MTLSESTCMKYKTSGPKCREVFLKGTRVRVHKMVLFSSTEYFPPLSNRREEAV